jgi:hypothetical protein
MGGNGKILMEKLLIPTIIILVALAAFGLGRLSVLVEEEGELIIHEPQGNI